jgi:hypothetical protein
MHSMDLFVPERLLENELKLAAYVHGYFKTKAETKAGRRPKKPDPFTSYNYLFTLLDETDDPRERFQIRNAAEWGAAVAMEESGNAFKAKYSEGCVKCEDPKDMVQYVQTIARGALPI